MLDGNNFARRFATVSVFNRELEVRNRYVREGDVRERDRETGSELSNSESVRTGCVPARKPLCRSNVNAGITLLVVAQRFVFVCRYGLASCRGEGDFALPNSRGRFSRQIAVPGCLENHQLR